MPTSQFIQYTSSDASGPGLLAGTVGDLLRVLDACLVNGYSGKAAAGWSKPIANSGNIGCYKNGTGSTQLVLLINDNGPNVTSAAREAWAVGWESIAGIGAPVGTGSGQFPTPAQSLTTGHVVFRKSTSADATGRQWRLFADKYCFHLFVAEGFNGTSYFCGVSFGDIYALSAGDTYRCLLLGGDSENPTTNGVNLQQKFATHTFLQAVIPGHYMARPYGGTGSSQNVGKHGDIGKSPFSIAPYYYIDGLPSAANGPDNSLLVAPVVIFDATGNVRGRMRGVYQVCCGKNGFADGTSFSGGGDFAGKTFQLVNTVAAYNNNAAATGGMIAIETSATLETN